MNTYPGIYKALDGAIYYYLNKSTVFLPHREQWQKDEDVEDHKKDTNITREYLANAYGEVKSKEHAEFIVKLAEGAGFDAAEHHRIDKWFCFSEDQLFFFTEVLTASDAAEKQITIPLPPKEPKKVSMNEIKVNVTNNTDSLVQVTKSDDESSIFICVSDLPKELESEGISQLERKPYQGGGLWKPFIAKAIKEPEPKEWPQVGDEVAWSPKLSRKGTLLNVYEGMAWVKDSYGEFVSIEVNKLKKPLTPEEELESRIRGMIEFFDYNSKAIAEYIISCELKV